MGFLMVFEWPWLWFGAKAALAATVLAFPAACALGWRMAADARLSAVARAVTLLPAPALLAAWATGSLVWTTAAALVVALAALARETGLHLRTLPAPWFESLQTLDAPAWRAAWPSLRAPLFTAAAGIAVRLLLEVCAGLLLRGRGV
jgi:hypothetical protein